MNKPTSKFMYLNKIFTVSLSWEDVKQSQKGINYKIFLPCGDNFFHFFVFHQNRCNRWISDLIH